jgi:2-keto-3-deoxy-6-phosphogluconate aldolase
MSRIPLQAIVNEAPIIAVVRRPNVDPVRCIENLFQTGVRLIEITMDTPGAVDVLETQRSRVPTDALLGADFVKVFPASALGPGYFRELRGPFAQIPLVASGGINVENAADFITSGVDALGVGGALIPKSNDDFDRCAQTAWRLLEVARNARASR